MSADNYLPIPEFDWSDECTSTIDEQLLAPDSLGRARYANFLTNYLSIEGKNRNFVLNLNADWGAGKTYFLKRWIEEIKDISPIVYIDAWSQDYSDDPLLTTVSSILSQLETQDNDFNEEIKAAKRSIWKLFKATAPLIAKGLVHKISGAHFDDLSEASSNAIEFTTESEENKNTDDSSETLDNIAFQVTTALIKDHQEKLESIKHFKKSINELIKLKAKLDKKEYPAYIFIDELDRCRPTYAIEMLETIKHFFDLPNIVFIVATDTNQLQHSIKVVYGSEFNAEGYLGRFFNRRLTLNTPDRKLFIQNLPQVNTICDHITSKKWGFSPYYYNRDDITELLAQFLNFHDLSLRSVEKVIDQLASIVYRTTGKECIDLVILFALLTWKEKNFAIYLKIKNNKDLIKAPLGPQLNIVESYPDYAPRFSITLKYYLENLIVRLTNDNPQQSIDMNINKYLIDKIDSLTKKKSEEIYNKQFHHSAPSRVISPLSGERLQRVIIEAVYEDCPQIALSKYFDLVDLATSFDD